MIFYISGTGNTEWVAGEIAKATNDRLVNVCSSEQTNYALTGNERIGFCFPVHGWRPPMLLRQFIKKLHLENFHQNYCFVLCTAGDTVGEAINMQIRDLLSRNITVDSCFSLAMPESYVGLPFMDVDPIEKERRKKDIAVRLIKEYIPQIVERRKCIKLPNLGRWRKINTRLLGFMFTHCLITDRHFRVDTDKCIKCGICAKQCPVNDIEGGKGEFPVWKHNHKCLTCFACYHHCPVHAIEYGWMTKGKGQYWFSKNQKTSAPFVAKFGV